VTLLSQHHIAIATLNRTTTIIIMTISYLFGSITEDEWKKTREQIDNSELILGTPYDSSSSIPTRKKTRKQIDNPKPTLGIHYDLSNSISESKGSAWLDRITPLLPLLEAGIPLLVVGDDALCVLERPEDFIEYPKVLQVVVPDKFLRIAASKLQQYDIADTMAERLDFELFTLRDRYSVGKHYKTFAFPAETTSVLRYTAPPKQDETNPRFIFIHSESIFQLDVTDNSRSCALQDLPLEDLPLEDPRRNIRFPSVDALFDYVIDLAFEPPHEYFHMRLRAALSSFIRKLLRYGLPTPCNSSADESDCDELKSAQEDTCRQHPDLVRRHTLMLSRVKEENRAYLNRQFELQAGMVDWEDQAWERLQLKNARL